ncbi:TonB-dependent receptor [Emcibacter sp. SYSU 3D8]|uniref:TonB-dependent receptor n=1 Tax=Emcibacter sp. SYSU 3D8 TaxID=3133969 RepID=UPI0031FE869D
MTTGKLGLSTALCMSLLGLGAGAAYAQDAAAAGASRPGIVTGVETVTVTSQKKEESIQDVPISVTAVTGAKMENLHATTLEALQGYIPNVQIGQFANVTHGAVFNIRGMGVIEPDPYAGTTVVVVQDEVPQFFNMTALLDTYDLERVEILRGPQGTLFGANSTGGVVQVVTRGPSGDFGVNAQATYGNYDTIEFKAGLDFPIIEDVLSGRVTLSHHQRDGYVTNIVDGKPQNDRDRTAFRLNLTWDKGENFRASLISEYHMHRDGSGASIAGDTPGDPLLGIPGDVQYQPAGTVYPNPESPDAVSLLPMYESPCLIAGQRCKAPKKYYSARDTNIPDMSNMDTYSFTYKMAWDSPIGDLVSVTAYKHFRLREFTDQDWTPKFQDDTDRRTAGYQFSQELRDTFQPWDGVEVLIGAFFANYAYDHYQDFRIQFAAPGLRQLTEFNSETTTMSAFLQTYVDVTDRFRLNGGVRFTHETTDMSIYQPTFIDTTGKAQLLGRPFNRMPSPTELTLGIVEVDGKDSWDNIGGKVGFEFDASDDAMIYGYYAHGFKSGGFVGRIGIPQDIGPYNPEYVDTLELGLKSDWFDNRLRVNVTGFYNWYSDIQLASIYFFEDDFGNTINGNSIQNAASAHTKGIEAEIIAVPVNGLTLNGSLGWLKATYSEFLFFDGATGELVDLSGAALQNSPKWTINVGAEYAFLISDNFEIRTNVQYKYVAKKYNVNLQNTARAEIQPTHTVDMNLDFGPPEGTWSVGLYARNLFDNRYISSVFDAPGTLGLVNYADPRTYGVTVKLKI